MSDLHEMAIELAKDKLHKVSRLTVVDEDGRSYERWFKEGEHIEYQFQDDGKTLKIFVGTHDWGIGDLIDET